MIKQNLIILHLRNKGFKEEDKKEVLLKRLKNIEDKNEEHLKIIKDKADIQSQIDYLMKI